MIRRLQLKFVAICMALITAVLATVLFSMFFSMRQSLEELSGQVLRQAIQMDGRPGGLTMDGEGRYVRLNGETTIFRVAKDLLDPLMVIALSGMEG